MRYTILYYFIRNYNRVFTYVPGTSPVVLSPKSPKPISQARSQDAASETPAPAQEKELAVEVSDPADTQIVELFDGILSRIIDDQVIVLCLILRNTLCLSTYVLSSRVLRTSVPKNS